MHGATGDLLELMESGQTNKVTIIMNMWLDKSGGSLTNYKHINHLYFEKKCLSIFGW